MPDLERFGSEMGRSLALMELGALEEWPIELEVGSPHFVLFLTADVAGEESAVLEELGRTAIRQGCVYMSAWGPGCERLHDAFDWAVIERDPDSTMESHIGTSWHDDESLDDALWFALNCAYPAEDYEETCRTTLAVTIGRPDWAAHMRERLRDPEKLSNDVT